MEYPDFDTVFKAYCETLFTLSPKDAAHRIKTKKKLLERPDKMMCQCYRVYLRKNYIKHLKTCPRELRQYI